MKLLLTILFTFASAISAVAQDYYASPTGSGTACTIGAPCALQTILNDTTKCNNNTFYLRDGVYAGKFNSTLDNCTVTSYPGEWAVIDGDKTTTLSADINASTQTITVASTAGMTVAGTIAIDTELMQVSVVNNPTTVTVNRGWSPNIGGAVSHTAGATVRLGGGQLSISGSGTTYKNFEIRNSYTQRDLEPDPITGQGCCGFYSFVRGAGISNTGGSNSFINLIIHDNLDGIFTGSASSNTLLYGVITYNNGSHENGPAGAGNGMYMENTAGYSRVYETLSLNNFNQGAQLFGVSGPYVGGDVQGSVFAGSGRPLSINNRNMLYGPDSQISPTGSVTDSHFYRGSTAVTFGFGAGVTTGTFTGNYIGGAGNSGFNRSTITTLTFTGNKIFDSPENVLAPEASGTWDNNIYYNTGAAATKFGNTTDVANQTFATWKTQTGFDAASSIDSGNLPDTVIVRPNTYEAGRANIIIYAYSAPTNINVDLSTTGLANGQAYTIKNAFDYFGTSVMTGTYSSASPTVSVPLNGAALNVAAPIEDNDPLVFTPSTTCPNFCLMVVVPGAQTQASVKGKIGGAVRLKGVRL